jgi:hypothetical protein
MNEKIAQYIKNRDYPSYIKARYAKVADYEELIFENEDFHDVDWRGFSSSMSVFLNCNLDSVVLPPGQPIRIENCSAKNMNIRGITAIIHAKESDFSGLAYDNETVLANSKEPSDIPSTFENCIFDQETKEIFLKQGVVFKG